MTGLVMVGGDGVVCEGDACLLPAADVAAEGGVRLGPAAHGRGADAAATGPLDAGAPEVVATA